MNKKFVYAVLFFLSCSLHARPLTELLPEERNTVELFQHYSPNVVYVHRLETYMSAQHQMFDVAAGSGSGIVWNKEGYIVTNFHVVRGADKLAISMGHATFPAEVVGVEPYKDIAVLRVNPKKAAYLLKNLNLFQLAQANELFVGQKAIAIGNPFGLDHSLTVGVISALGREVPGAAGVTIRNMIQTDASVNPGNSGGPLLDSSGRLIGMTTAIFSNSGTSAGVNFAVPADDIGRIVPQLIKHGRIVMVGIGISRVSPGIARSLGVNHGVLIADVLPGSPAEGAGLVGTHRALWGGLQLGDVIVGVNGHLVANYDAMYRSFSDMKVGARVTLDVERNGRVFKVKLKTIDIAAY